MPCTRHKPVRGTRPAAASTRGAPAVRLRKAGRPRVCGAGADEPLKTTPSSGGRGMRERERGFRGVAWSEEATASPRQSIPSKQPKTQYALRLGREREARSRPILTAPGVEPPRPATVGQALPGCAGEAIPARLLWVMYGQAFAYASIVPVLHSSVVQRSLSALSGEAPSAVSPYAKPPMGSAQLKPVGDSPQLKVPEGGKEPAMQGTSGEGWGERNQHGRGGAKMPTRLLRAAEAF